MPLVGDVAPDFSAEATNGHQFQLSLLKGRPVVLYFYPRAFTMGCTIETKRFRDNYAELAELGAEVVGISTDGFEKQCRFANEQALQFPLIADEDRRISVLYGVHRPLLNRNKRVTFVVDEEGIVRGKFHHELQISRHLDDVFQFLRRSQRRSSVRT